jgi:hypothetical protein
MKILNDKLNNNKVFDICTLTKLMKMCNPIKGLDDIEGLRLTVREHKTKPTAVGHLINAESIRLKNLIKTKLFDHVLLTKKT